MCRVVCGEPATIPGNSNQMDIVLVLVHGLKNRRRRQQRNFMFAAATAKENAYAQFFHESGNETSVYCEEKDLLHVKYSQFKLRGLGCGIRHGRLPSSQL